ncbi:serine hydrolase domain-containing protein [Pantoea agglomerans]|uniref:serine hydrolase domain-containing protein n=1 Tax=Enterobacter agglomerans TaxID=549 RepID=UPI0013B8AEFC|nr:serine hydrolase domain-containing protein [Pantoea agglomerans]NEG58703.1 serine hydrolase [Pantoea agglomerans]NEH00471.1 serine hydrolase [Pantoea agglomerans]NEH02555.1 serine hydrolase [Pantoea agglomerans]NEH15709.1 serine hydrolase [Pantoea agglomerans]
MKNGFTGRPAVAVSLARLPPGGQWISRLMTRFMPAFIFLLAGCGTLSQTSAPVGDRVYLTHATFHENVDDIVQHYMQQKQVPGISIAVIHRGGPTRYYAFGVTDRVHRYPITPDTLFALGSLSKGVTAEVIIQLVDQGKLRWSDTLADLLPEGVHFSADARRITLLQLVTHTSGLPRQDMDLTMLQQFVRYLDTGENFYGNLDSDKLLSYLADFSAPAVRLPHYSNLGYALLGYILRTRFHQDIQTLASQLIFTPLKMNQSSFVPETLAGYPLRALGHAGDQPKLIRRGTLTPDWHFHGNMVAAASLYSNARDLSAYLRAHLSTTGDAARDRAFAAAEQAWYQQGAQVQNIAWVTDTFEGQQITYQVGYIGGYSSFIGYDKRNGNAIVVLQNGFNWSNYLGIALLVDLATQDKVVRQ